MPWSRDLTIHAFPSLFGITPRGVGKERERGQSFCGKLPSGPLVLGLEQRTGSSSELLLSLESSLESFPDRASQGAARAEM